MKSTAISFCWNGLIESGMLEGEVKVWPWRHDICLVTLVKKTLWLRLCIFENILLRIGTIWRLRSPRQWQTVINAGEEGISHFFHSVKQFAESRRAHSAALRSIKQQRASIYYFPSQRLQAISSRLSLQKITFCALAAWVVISLATFFSTGSVNLEWVCLTFKCARTDWECSLFSKKVTAHWVWRGVFSLSLIWAHTLASASYLCWHQHVTAAVSGTLSGYIFPRFK